MATRGKHTEVEKAYAAGAIDGEGHIIIYKHDRTKNPHYKAKSPTYILIVGCTNTDERMIQFLHERWGACRQTRKRSRDNPHWKIAYEWTIQARMALEFLKEIQPYIIIKKEKVDLAISFQEGMEQRKDEKGRMRQLPVEEIERREEIWKKLNLHRKGTGSRRD